MRKRLVAVIVTVLVFAVVGVALAVPVTKGEEEKAAIQTANGSGGWTLTDTDVKYDWDQGAYQHYNCPVRAKLQVKTYDVDAGDFFRTDASISWQFDATLTATEINGNGFKEDNKVRWSEWSENYPQRGTAPWKTLAVVTLNSETQNGTAKYWRLVADVDNVGVQDVVDMPWRYGMHFPGWGAQPIDGDPFAYANFRVRVVDVANDGCGDS